MAKEKMTVKAYHWDKNANKMEKTPTDTRYDMPHSEENTTGNIQSYGMPTTLEASLAMFNKYKTAAANDSSIFSKLYCVTFSKASIFRILSQEGCEAIRIWQAIPGDDGVISFMLEGLTGDYRPVKENIILTAANEALHNHDEGDPLYEERGNGGDEGTLLSSMPADEISSLSLSEFMKVLFDALAKK